MLRSKMIKCLFYYFALMYSISIVKSDNLIDDSFRTIRREEQGNLKFQSKCYKDGNSYSIGFGSYFYCTDTVKQAQNEINIFLNSKKGQKLKELNTIKWRAIKAIKSNDNILFKYKTLKSQITNFKKIMEIVGNNRKLRKIDKDINKARDLIVKDIRFNTQNIPLNKTLESIVKKYYALNLVNNEFILNNIVISKIEATEIAKKHIQSEVISFLTNKDFFYKLNHNQKCSIVSVAYSKGISSFLRSDYIPMILKLNKDEYSRSDCNNIKKIFYNDVKNAKKEHKIGVKNRRLNEFLLFIHNTNCKPSDYIF